MELFIVNLKQAVIDSTPTANSNVLHETKYPRVILLKKNRELEGEWQSTRFQQSDNVFFNNFNNQRIVLFNDLIQAFELACPEKQRNSNRKVTLLSNKLSKRRKGP